MVKPIFRTKSISTKVTDEEYAQLQALAGGRALSEWVREVLLGQVEQSMATAAEETLLAELVGLRTILLNLLFKLVNGEKLTAEQMQQFIARADADKFKKAMEKLEAANTGKAAAK